MVQILAVSELTFIEHVRLRADLRRLKMHIFRSLTRDRSVWSRRYSNAS